MIRVALNEAIRHFDGFFPPARKEQGVGQSAMGKRGVRHPGHNLTKICNRPVVILHVEENQASQMARPEDVFVDIQSLVDELEGLVQTVAGVEEI